MTDSNSLDTQQFGGCGAFLRAAREEAGLSLSEVGSRLKMPVKVLQALEGEQWQQLGAPVFVRGQLRSYARLLKVDVEPYLERAQLDMVQPVELISRSYTPKFQRLMESAQRRAIYVVITLCFFAVPAWLAIQSRNGDGGAPTASLDAMPPVSVPSSREAAPKERERSTLPAAPYVASMAPPISRPSVPSLNLRFRGESWVQIIAPDGTSIEQALLKAGDERSYAKGQVGRIVLGNAAAVEVQHAGSTVDLTPFQRANVARFAVSSEGSLAPVAD
ncbi:RodZ domain-containing protein [Pseudoxanthomonas sp. UTMC 1351]|uniref:RodZ domain-containing protein n=1 Tax=Pseudoxanthomonas sp. UTMC 1351 TaxID=2695853 RepID=UPI0034CE2E0D